MKTALAVIILIFLPDHKPFFSRFKIGAYNPDTVRTCSDIDRYAE